MTVFALLLLVPMAGAVPQSGLAAAATGLGDAAVSGSPALTLLLAREGEPVASVTRVDGHPLPARMAADGVAGPALRAYQAAEAAMRIADPSCRLGWEVLAGIGRVESDHGRRDGSALGPMRFLPAAWSMVGADGDGDGDRDPQDLDDAALAAAAYLCAGAGDLGGTGGDGGVRRAVFGYNHSPAYVDLVVGIAEVYERTIVALPAVAGAGVPVGVGLPGQGALVGASDNVADGPEHPLPADDGAVRRRDDIPVRGGRADRGAGEERRARDGEPGATRPRDRSRPADPDGGPRAAGGRGTEASPTPAPRPTRSPTTPGTNKTTKPQPTHEPGQPGKPGRPGRTKPHGDAEPTPALREFAGTVARCGTEHCLETPEKNYLLEGGGPYQDLLGETITVIAVLDGTVLLVDHVVE